MSNPVPMFAKRHYEALAAIVERRTSLLRRMVQVHHHELTYRASFQESCTIANELADLFQGDNPRFDRARFLQACGLADDSATAIRHEDGCGRRGYCPICNGDEEEE